MFQCWQELSPPARYALGRAASQERQMVTSDATSKMGEVRVGLCSWTDKSLIESGAFYPPGVDDAKGRLQYYAREFPVVEVDSSYYNLPSERNSRLWAERTPDGFTFNVKAYSLFTNHPTRTYSLPKGIFKALPHEAQAKERIYFDDVPGELRNELWGMFDSALRPLHEVGKLGTILFQFPHWFYPGRKGFSHILGCQRSLPHYRLAIEFRNNVWLNQDNVEDTLGFLEAYDMTFVCVDEPQGFRSSCPPLAAVTRDIAMVRFHGRNVDTWEKKGITAAQRFNWYYKREEIDEWVPRIREMAGEAREVHLMINTCYRDQSVVNARLLQEQLSQVG